MTKLSFKNKGIRSTATLVDCIILCTTNRSHCQRKVVGADAVTKIFSNHFLTDEILVKIMRGLGKRRKGDFSLIATHAKFDVSKSGAGKGFCLPMKSVTIRALNVHLIKGMNLPRWVKGVACNGKVNWDK